MTQNGDMAHIGNLDFDIEFQGPNTLVRARLYNFEGETHVGYGLARCREEDHFDINVGADIAAGRALKDLGVALEAQGLSDSITELQHEANQVAALLSEFADRVREGFETFAEAIRVRG